MAEFWISCEPCFTCGPLFHSAIRNAGLFFICRRKMWQIWKAIKIFLHQHVTKFPCFESEREMAKTYRRFYAILHFIVTWCKLFLKDPLFPDSFKKPKKQFAIVNHFSFLSWVLTHRDIVKDSKRLRSSYNIEAFFRSDFLFKHWQISINRCLFSTSSDYEKIHLFVLLHKWEKEKSNGFISSRNKRSVYTYIRLICWFTT